MFGDIGDSENLGDDADREGLREVLDDLALAATADRIEQLDCVSSDHPFRFRNFAGRQEGHHDLAVVAVHRRVELQCPKRGPIQFGHEDPVRRQKRLVVLGDGPDIVVPGECVEAAVQVTEIHEAFLSHRHVDVVERLTFQGVVVVVVICSRVTFHLHMDTVAGMSHQHIRQITEPVLIFDDVDAGVRTKKPTLASDAEPVGALAAV